MTNAMVSSFYNLRTDFHFVLDLYSLLRRLKYFINMIGCITSATYNSYFLGASITASGLPAAILHVGSLLVKTIAVAGLLLYMYVKQRCDGSRD